MKDIFKNRLFLAILNVSQGTDGIDTWGLRGRGRWMCYAAKILKRQWLFTISRHDTSTFTVFVRFPFNITFPVPLSFTCLFLPCPHRTVAERSIDFLTSVCVLKITLDFFAYKDMFLLCFWSSTRERMALRLYAAREEEKCLWNWIHRGMTSTAWGC